MKICTGCLTERGNYRKKNQDSAVCCVKREGKELLAVACVCDGIGSLAQSEIASSMITEGISRWFSGVSILFPKVMNKDVLVDDLEMTLRELNELIIYYQKESGNLIGCTMSLLLIAGYYYYVFHVGDSRIYRVGEKVQQLTSDEVTLIEENGRLKTLLANYFGKSEDLQLNRIDGELQKGMCFLLGTDGLFKKLPKEELGIKIGWFKSDRQAQRKCEELFQRVINLGERDNVSCILVNVF